MYQLESAKVKPFNQNGFWLDVDVSTKTIGQMFLEYRKAIFILSNSALSGTLYLDMESIKPLSFLDESLTLSQWFTAIGNLALPTTTTSPDFNPLLVKYGDAWKANYEFQKVHPTLALDVVVNEADKTDLLLKRSDIDALDMSRYCLISVNGLLHKADGSVNGLYVRDGAKSSRIANKTNVGIISFKDVGEFDIIPINRNMIKQPSETLRLKEKIYLDLNTDLSNKTVLLSLGGYLHAVDNIVRIAGLTSIVIDFYKIPFIKRFFQQRKMMDLSSLALESNYNNPSQISVEEIYSDEVIKRYLELSQSFLIVVDNNEFFCDYKLTESGKLPGIFYSYDKTIPVYPLQLGLGLIGNYWKQYDDGKWVMAMDESYDNHYNFETTSYLTETSIDDTRRAEKPFEYSDAYFMVMGIP